MAAQSKNTTSNALTNFTVKGPVKVPVKKLNGGKIIDTAKLEAFWKTAKTGHIRSCGPYRAPHPNGA